MDPRLTIVGGIKVLPHRLMPEFKAVHFRTPRSKSKRIQKKWAKRPQNHRNERYIIRVGDQIMAHPNTVEYLKIKTGANQ